MSKVKRIYIRQDELSLDVAASLKVTGWVDAQNQTNRSVLRWELVIEFDGVRDVEKAYTLYRSGRQAGIVIDIDILKVDSKMQLSIYMVGLLAHIQALNAKYRYTHYGFPPEIVALLPTPSEIFGGVTIDTFPKAFDKIATALHRLGEKGFGNELPPTTDRFIREIGENTREESHARAVLDALSSLAWGRTGRTIHLAERWARLGGYDPAVAKSVYIAMGARTDRPHSAPARAAHRKANDWIDLIGLK